MNIKRIIYSLLLFSLIFLACKNSGKSKKEEVVRDVSITLATSFNNLFLDSAQILQFLQKHPEDSMYKSQYIDFYKHRNYEYAWFDTSGVAEQALNFMNLLSTTITELNDSSLYNKKLIKLYNSYITDSAKHRKGFPVETELSLTGQFFAYASKVYKGSDIDAQELGWFIPRKKLDFTALLDSVIVTKGKDENRYLPLNRQYKQLQEAIAKYYNIQKTDQGEDSIPSPKKGYEKGDSSPVITQIKKRLFLLGDLPENDTTPRYNSSLLAAVKSYQGRMGLKNNGFIGKQTVAELNVPDTERIKQLLVNLERVRWMPPESDSNYIIVNIPEYKLYVYDNGRLQFDMSVIVGNEGNSTVIFTGDIKYIVFSPYWNVPSSIVKKEILPSMQRNPDYLEKQNMEITGEENGLPVVRQKPGEKNSLGLVKFLFPNSFNIYLHDTPNRNLFSQTQRNFSHGCIRIQDPKKMALYFLRYDTSYTPHKIDSLMHLPEEKWVTIKKPVRVFIGYFTAWVDRSGKLNFRKDIYGHDKKMEEKLFVKQ